MSANKFVLKHHHIEVDYTIGITPDLPALIYKDGPNVKTFPANEITTDETGLGSLVSVSLVRSIDTGGERFLPARTRRPFGANREIHYGWRLRVVRWA